MKMSSKKMKKISKELKIQRLINKIDATAWTYYTDKDATQYTHRIYIIALKKILNEVIK